jgi:soluble lytic murein transglycosylase-like protein
MIGIPLHCINDAAVAYHIPAKLIVSILEVEQGQVGKISKNSNGSYDIGPMQINSSWLAQFKKYGITQNDLQFDACTNIMVGTWILSKKITNRNDILIGIGDYNSHTPRYNQAYYLQVKMTFTQINSL